MTRTVAPRPPTTRPDDLPLVYVLLDPFLHAAEAEAMLREATLPPSPLPGAARAEDANAPRHRPYRPSRN